MFKSAINITLKTTTQAQNQAQSANLLSYTSMCCKSASVNTQILLTSSNVTTINDVRRASARLLPVRGAPWWVLLQHSIMGHSLMRVLSYFSSSSVVSRAFSALCVYSKFGHHPHPLGYLTNSKDVLLETMQLHPDGIHQLCAHYYFLPWYCIPRKVKNYE